MGSGKTYGYGYESLAPHKKDRHMEPFLVSLEPSKADEERSAHDGQEFIYVLEGAMEVMPPDIRRVLVAADATAAQVWKTVISKFAAVPGWF